MLTTLLGPLSDALDKAHDLVEDCCGLPLDAEDPCLAKIIRTFDAIAELVHEADSLLIDLARELARHPLDGNALRRDWP